MIDDAHPEIRVLVQPMPPRIKAYTCRVFEYYTIMVNEYLSDEVKLREVRHELDHIENDDFDKDESVNEIEIRAHCF